jgi:hypothetical protein
LLDRLEAVVRQEVREVSFQTLLLPFVCESFEDSQSRPLFRIRDVEFPKLVLDPAKLGSDLLFKLGPTLGRCLSQ